MTAAILFLLFMFFLMTVLNYFTAHRLESVPLTEAELLPSASILIPARNEAHNLVRLLPSLLSSNYRSFDIIVLDDNSNDQTYDVAIEILAKSPIPFQVIRGKTWNPGLGLSGKNYACQQLAEKADGEVLIFCDADIVVSPDTVAKTLSFIKRNPKASGVSALPKLKATGFFEQLVFPWIMQIPLMISLPLRWAWQIPASSMQMANGQWLAIRKQNYFNIGGHRSLGTSVVEDMRLAKSLTEKLQGGLIPAIATQDITVEMYKNWKSMIEGFSKNLILIYGGKILPFTSLLTLVNIVFFYPLWACITHPEFATLGLGILMILRMLISQSFGHGIFHSLKQVILIWPSLLALNYFSFQVIKNNLQGKIEWKGRSTIFSEKTQ